jgi:hypothetical protein
MEKAVEAIVGLSAFQAEQRTAMCLSRSGLDYNDLWEAKRQAIEQVRGLSVWRGSESVSGIGGYESLKQDGERLRIVRNLRVAWSGVSKFPVAFLQVDL